MKKNKNKKLKKKNFILRHILKGTLTRQTNWGKKKETKLENLTHSDFKISYKDMVIKTLTWWQ